MPLGAASAIRSSARRMGKQSHQTSAPASHGLLAGSTGASKDARLLTPNTGAALADLLWRAEEGCIHEAGFPQVSITREQPRVKEDQTRPLAHQLPVERSSQDFTRARHGNANA